jgi:hypothetical protein
MEENSTQRMDLFFEGGPEVEVPKVVPAEAAQPGSYEFSLHDANTFSAAWELVPGRGAFEKTHADVIRKNQRNCRYGGSRAGWCEAYPNPHKCIYVLAYERLKSHGAERSLGEGLVPPVNYDLNQTSSWIDFYLGRDHSAPKLKIETVARKENAK